MTPSLRVKFGLIATAALLVGAFAWSGASGQFRPPFQRPGFNPPRMQQPPMMRPPMTIGWKCSRCGHIGEGAVPPRICPGCGATLINGVGNGSGGGLMGNPPMNPAANPPFVNPNPPAFNPPPGNNVSPPPPPANLPAVETKPSSTKKLVIALVIGILGVGVFVVVGGALLLIYIMRNNDSSSDRPRRRIRREVYED